MTMPPPSMERQQIVIPAQGMVDIRDVLTEMLSEFGAPDKIGELTGVLVNAVCTWHSSVIK